MLAAPSMMQDSVLREESATLGPRASWVKLVQRWWRGLSTAELVKYR